ncbi:non-hydrolyzing UDP-N-acetylglucosamine 2-epimerase [Ferruginivarius sediminum]|uniref:UDP-N-acetylglucosamine 2-epimerase (Non-hydrolyzing) n=1 Tax=Ferruginivarius sediminum TaxID=2661937 RepID=A0A369T6R4_9PROT|nr:UDP-N-acetylglucosamine 2-epimerase (non-hydrolyzing) [Ferruginivarius sediminum]RDD60144.1 UDP-N-acetylglucosamine 2-epimerase (non-hydrolyzing) [Ferruginivarius sediminum]
MKIVSVVGARPQFIKASVVSKSLRSRDGVQETLVHSGQHYDIAMSDVFFEELGLPTADMNLSIGSGSHGTQTGRMLQAIEGVLVPEAPDWVIVYGDTNTTLAGALAAAKLHIPVVHVEAGLRSFDMGMPEEINRVLTDRVASLLFAPTQVAVSNLHSEGFKNENIYCVGDVMYDVALTFGHLAENRIDLLKQLSIQSGKYALATIHRAENTDDIHRLCAIFTALRNLSREITVVLPLHPRTRARLNAARLLEQVQQELVMIEPVGYMDMAALTRHAALVVTDSGGLQKESYFHGIPCAILRDCTEWIELVQLGWNELISPSAHDISERLVQLLWRETPPRATDGPFGDGHAAEAIAETICSNTPSRYV